jgi:hypothetical protein
MEKDLSSSVHLELGIKKKRKSGQETEVSHGHFIPNSRITRAPRVIRDGKVAVIYQPHHGLGWYSEHKIEALLFAPEIVFMIEKEESGSKVYEYCRSMKYGWILFVMVSASIGCPFRKSFESTSMTEEKQLF